MKERQMPLPDLGSVPVAIPELSFAIPAYNRPEMLKETIESIINLDGLEDYEIVITDDLGLPETEAVVRGFLPAPITYYRNAERLGGVENWNRALALSRGRWATLIHEDDCFYPWFYRLVREHMRPEVSAICPRSIQGDKAPEVTAPHCAAISRRVYKAPYFIKSGFTAFPGVVIRREVLEALNGFDPKWESVADYEFWYRLSVSGPIEVIQAIGCFYRLSESQWTTEEWPNMLGKCHLLRLRVAREQFGRSRLAVWLARFFTSRQATSYANRFPARPAVLLRCLKFRKISCSRLPSGWAWCLLKLISR